MTEAPLSFADQQASSSEPLGGASPIAANVMLDKTGMVRRRPGISMYSGAPSTSIDSTGISGLWSTLSNDLYAVGQGLPPAERPIYKVTSSGASMLGGGVPPAGLDGTTRPVFTETELLLVIAGGLDMEKIVLSTGVSSRLTSDPTAPFCTHVIPNTLRLLANAPQADTSKVFFSDVFQGFGSFTGALVWTPGVGNTAGFFSAEARPDPVVALAENTNEVWAFGSGTTQIYTPDPSVTYAPTSAREVGCSAPYSIVKVDQEFLWLDDKRRFVKSDGRTFSVLSDPIQQTLDAMSTISDCFGYWVIAGHYDVIVWQFPTDGRAFAYQVGAGWSEWLGWSDVTTNWTPLPVTAAARRQDQSVTIVGLSDGRIGTWDLTATSDLGTRINAYVETGYINRGTDARKHCRNVKLSLRRGTTAATSAPQAFLRWRDKPGPWQQQIPISLGASGDTEIVVPLRSLGIYRRRQWSFVFSDAAVDLALVAATEEFDVLDT